MHAALLITLLLPCQANSNPPKKSKLISGTHRFSASEWSDDTYVLSLQAKPNAWDKGNAWVFKFEKGTEPCAWRGTFEFFLPRNDDDDALILSLAFSRKYVYGAEDGKERWVMKRYEPKGVDLEVPLEDSSVPDIQLSLSVTRSYFIDDKGNETSKADPSASLLKKLTGDNVRAAPRVDCFAVGDTVSLGLGRGRLQTFANDPPDLPPSFKPIQPKQVVANKPIQKTGKEKLWEDLKALNKAEQAAKAIVVIEKLLLIDPDDAKVYQYQGWAHSTLGNKAASIESYSKAISLDPKNAHCLRSRASLYAKRSDFKLAIQDYEALLQLNPKDTDTLNAYAWLLSTCPDKTIRNGEKALQHAQEACKRSEFKSWSFVDTLAAAFAERGDFAKATLWATEALDICQNEQYYQQLKDRLALYQSRKPYREQNAATSPSP